MTRRVTVIGGTRNGATYRPYRPTNLRPLHSARATDAFMRLLAVLVMAGIVVAFLAVGASA